MVNDNEFYREEVLDLMALLVKKVKSSNRSVRAWMEFNASKKMYTSCRDVAIKYGLDISNLPRKLRLYKK